MMTADLLRRNEALQQAGLRPNPQVIKGTNDVHAAIQETLIAPNHSGGLISLDGADRATNGIAPEDRDNEPV